MMTRDQLENMKQKLADARQKQLGNPTEIPPADPKTLYGRLALCMSALPGIYGDWSRLGRADGRFDPDPMVREHELFEHPFPGRLNIVPVMRRGAESAIGNNDSLGVVVNELRIAVARVRSLAEGVAHAEARLAAAAIEEAPAPAPA